jgi:hypothetical protein
MSRTTGLVAIVLAVGAGGMIAWSFAATERAEELLYQRGESELVVTNLAHATLRLFRAGSNLEEAREIGRLSEGRQWLPAANYFLEADTIGGPIYYPAPITGYRAGPEKDGSLAITIRATPRESERTGRESPRCTAPTSTPIAIANAAGRIPLSRRDVHQVAARAGSAFGRTLKNFHSLRSVRVWSTTAFCHRTGARTGSAAHSAAHAQPSDCR